MTYPIANVIYGCPFPNGIDGTDHLGEIFEAAIEAWIGHDDGLFELGEQGGEDSLWSPLYSASPGNDPAGYFGELLNCADGYWDLKVEWFQVEVPAEIRTRVDTEWEKLPEPVRELLGRPRLAISWSDS